jgi:hypothetical protein
MPMRARRLRRLGHRTVTGSRNARGRIPCTVKCPFQTKSITLEEWRGFARSSNNLKTGCSGKSFAELSLSWRSLEISALSASVCVRAEPRPVSTESDCANPFISTSSQSVYCYRDPGLCVGVFSCAPPRAQFRVFTCLDTFKQFDERPGFF